MSPGAVRAETGETPSRNAANIMKTNLQKHLATLAPSLSIVTIWEPDQDSGPISSECDGFTPAEDYGWEAWQSEIRATAICGGEEVTGSAYLGGTFEKFGDDPARSNPEISGYENQMAEEALGELLARIESLPGEADYLNRQTVAFQIGDALAYLKEEPRRSYEAQRGPVKGYAVKTAKGYFATQGNTYWFQETPEGWALYSSEEHARETLERNHSASHEGGEIETIRA